MEIIDKAKENIKREVSDIENRTDLTDDQKVLTINS